MRIPRVPSFVDEWYEQFDQMEDTEVCRLLSQLPGSTAGNERFAVDGTGADLL